MVEGYYARDRQLLSLYKSPAKLPRQNTVSLNVIITIEQESGI